MKLLEKCKYIGSFLTLHFLRLTVGKSMSFINNV